MPSARFRSLLVAMAIMTGLLGSSAIVSRAEPQEAKNASLDEKFARAAALRKQADDENDPDKQLAFSAAFADALREAAAAIPEVPVATGKVPARFTRVILNKKRKNFDAIRFSAPRSVQSWDMVWQFVIPSHDGDKHDLTGWYIISGSGDLRGFANYAEKYDDPLQAVPLPHHRHVFQGLGGGAIKPGETYFIWFTFRDGTGEVPMFVKMHVQPPPPDTAARVKATQAALVRRIDMPANPGAIAAFTGGQRALVAVGQEALLVEADSGKTVGHLEQPSAVGSVAVTGDGRLAAIGLADGTIRLWDIEPAKEVRKLEGHSGTVNDLAFSADGKKLVSASVDRTARIWEAASGKELHKLEGFNDQVLRVAFSADGHRVATGASIQDPVGRVWDADSGKLVTRLEGNAEAIYAIAFSPDSKAVLTGGEDDQVRLFDAATGRMVRQFETKDGNVNGVGFLSGGKRAVSGGEDGDVVVWDVATGRELARYADHSMSITRMAVSFDGNRVFTGGLDRSVRVWEVPATAAGPRGAPGRARPKR